MQSMGFNEGQDDGKKEIDPPSPSNDFLKFKDRGRIFTHVSQRIVPFIYSFTNLIKVYRVFISSAKKLTTACLSTKK